MALGSPPCVRGKDLVAVSLFALDRITPAYAGKSVLLVHILDRPWDHPRVCGEKMNFLKLSQTMRGKVLAVAGGMAIPRITPAYAGKRDDIETGDLIHGITPAYAGKRTLAG